MMKMLIELNKSANDLWQSLDKIFSEQLCSKELLSDNTAIYHCNPESKNTFSEFGIIFSELSNSKSFIDNVTKWILFDNEDDESLPFQEIDVLQQMKEFNAKYCN